MKFNHIDYRFRKNLIANAADKIDMNRPESLNIDNRFRAI